MTKAGRGCHSADAGCRRFPFLLLVHSEASCCCLRGCLCCRCCCLSSRCRNERPSVLLRHCGRSLRFLQSSPAAASFPEVQETVVLLLMRIVAAQLPTTSCRPTLLVPGKVECGSEGGRLGLGNVNRYTGVVRFAVVLSPPPWLVAVAAQPSRGCSLVVVVTQSYEARLAHSLEKKKIHR